MISFSEVFDKDKLAIVGIVIGIMLSLSPIPTFIDIAVHSKTTGGYTVAPYISSFLCCSMWLTYAVMAGSAKSDLIPLNALSFVIYFIYCCIFLVYAPNRSSVLLIYMGALGTLAVTVSVAVFVKSLILVGVLATVANCLMFAAPLAVLTQVIKTKSVRYMPFLLSLTSFLCASVWLVWAFMVKDFFVLIPNALGTFFGLIQLCLYAVYWRISARNDNGSEPDRTSLRSPGREGGFGEEELTPMKKRSLDTVSLVSTSGGASEVGCSRR
jgi:solute carrier family 50 protein (sugar transporter)